MIVISLRLFLVFFLLNTSIGLSCNTSCDSCSECDHYSKGHILTLAPEYYFLKRTRDGGTKQTGSVFGGRASYDYIKRYNIYVGAQAFYGYGILNGHSGTDEKIKSHWNDEQVEAYLGYTFQCKNFPHFSFTPFGGYGYFRESNKFVSPSPLHLKFITQFGYFAYGFLSSAMVHPCISLGLNARFRTPWQPKCKISNDPEFDDVKLVVGEHLQYRIEVPIAYHSKFICNLIEFGLMPFYEMREYGGRENFPFDFFKTKIQIFGIDLKLIYRF